MGIEPRKEAVLKAKKNFNVQLFPIEWNSIHKHLTEKPQLIILSHVLEHLLDPISLLKYLKQYFPGAYLWIEVPDGEYETYKTSEYILHTLWVQQHLWSFTLQGLKFLFQREDIQIFNYKKIDRGTWALIENMKLKGEKILDYGCGIGIIGIMLLIMLLDLISTVALTSFLFLIP